MIRYFRELIFRQRTMGFDLALLFVSGLLFSRIADPTLLYSDHKLPNSAIYISFDRKTSLEKYNKFSR